MEKEKIQKKSNEIAFFTYKNLFTLYVIETICTTYTFIASTYIQTIKSYHLQVNELAMCRKKVRFECIANGNAWNPVFELHVKAF